MKVNWDEKGLVPVIVQHQETRDVLMLGYMNEEALEKTIELGKVTFFSRSKQRLWTKGEESGHFLTFMSVKNDCDQDALLVQALSNGPTCHKGTPTCWGALERTDFSRLEKLEHTISDRIREKEADSYIHSLMRKGIHKVAQKVGEEATELVIEACYDYAAQGKGIEEREALFLGEAADLLFHYLILLQAKGFTLKDVLNILTERAN